MQDATSRVSEISAILQATKGKIPNAEQICQTAILRGTSVEDVRLTLFAAMPGVQPVGRPTLDLEREGIDLSKYSFRRAILSAAENGGNVQGFEREVSQEIARQSRKDPAGFWVPHQITRADNIVSTPSLGGNLVAQTLQPGEFVNVLRNQARVVEAGARLLSGLVGNCIIPRQGDGTANNGAGTAYWVTEIASTTQSTPNFQQITLTPKCVTSWTKYSKQLLVQSTPSVDMLLRDDAAAILAIAIDKATLDGAGGAEPTGISGTAGVQTLALGTNGGNPSYAFWVSMEAKLAAQNADQAGTIAYLVNPATRAYAKVTPKTTVAGSYGFIWEPGNLINSYRALVTNQVSAALTKGTNTAVCSAAFAGVWSDLLIGTFGGTDYVVDPYSAAATRERCPQLRAPARLRCQPWWGNGFNHADSATLSLGADQSYTLCAWFKPTDLSRWCNRHSCQSSRRHKMQLANNCH